MHKRIRSGIDFYEWSNKEVEAIVFLVHSCGWLPDKDRELCDAIKILKERAERELDNRRKEIERD